MSTETVSATEFERQWREWHRRHEEKRAGPYGFLAITSLNFLTGTPRRLADAPGEWSTGDDGVRVVLADDEEIVVDGTPVCGEYRFGAIPERDSVTVEWGEVRIEVARRSGHDIVRPRHPDHPIRTGYGGTPTYPPDPRWVVRGRYVPFDTPVPTTVGAAVEGLQHVYQAPGRIEFELDGRALRLWAFDGNAPGSLSVLFTDLTSGVTTYAASRSLAIEAPAADGSVWLDFNRAVNLPCAYTPYATCPLPPADNRLPVAIEAGEQKPSAPAG